jgi:signal peptidase I
MTEGNSAEEQEKITTAKERGSLVSYLLVWARDLSLALVLAAVVILFIYQPVQVEGTSMMPALVDQERIFINKFTYRLGIEKIARGDTVVFLFPEDRTKSYIKRVIGLPGDVVSIDKGTVCVNGKPLAEDYVPEQYRDTQSMLPLKVMPDYYFVLGDHRTSSNDSRSWGPVHRSFIYGKAVFVYWPPEKIGPVQ